MAGRTGIFRILAGLLVLCTIGSAEGHDARPISVELKELPGFSYEVRLKVPDAIPAAAMPALRMPGGCEHLRTSGITSLRGSAQRIDLVSCPDDIRGAAVSLEFPGSNPSLSTLIRFLPETGDMQTTILPPGNYHWQIPESETAVGNVALQYTWLGIKHIWLGIDHLLFVLCLLFVAGGAMLNRWPRILVTITGFTVSHSITLALSVLDIVSLPIPAVEAAIALSIVFLALEIARENPNSWTYRYPVSVSASFGLLHGFGFAAVLREIGLPADELALALLTFNVGVELGQVVFIALVLMVAGLFRREALARSSRLRLATSYFVGSIAAFWLIDRTAAFWV